MTREPADDARIAPELKRRVFFAFWPDAQLRAAFVHATHKAVRACGGPPVPAHNLHVTLLFLGSVGESRIPDLVTIGARAAALLRDKVGAATAGPAAGAGLSSHLVFERIEFWEKARVLAATTGSSPEVRGHASPSARSPPAPQGAASGLAVATTLAEVLLQETQRAGFATDLKPFRPHVTLARKVHHPPRFMKMEPVPWRCSDFVLVDSKTLPEGPVYTVMERFSLQLGDL